jgi:hypothetical protein
MTEGELLSCFCFWVFSLEYCLSYSLGGALSALADPIEGQYRVFMFASIWTLDQ